MLKHSASRNHLLFRATFSTSCHSRSKWPGPFLGARSSAQHVNATTIRRNKRNGFSHPRGSAKLKALRIPNALPRVHLLPSDTSQNFLVGEPLSWEYTPTH